LLLLRLGAGEQDRFGGEIHRRGERHRRQRAAHFFRDHAEFEMAGAGARLKELDAQFDRDSRAASFELPAPLADAGLDALRKQIGEISQHKDRAGLARLVVALGEIRRVLGCVRIEADGEFEVAVLLVEIRGDGIAPHAAADRLAEERIAAARATRPDPVAALYRPA